MIQIGATASSKNRRILIVDDNPSIHDDFRKVLGANPTAFSGVSSRLSELEAALFSDATPVGEGRIQSSHAPTHYSLSFAMQGIEGVSQVSQAFEKGEPFALVFLDVRMPPGIDGVETARRIWEVAPDTELILCTAFSDHSHEDIVAKLGVNDRLLFLKKPFDPVVVRQMAIALTTKWNMGVELRAHMLELENRVAAKTSELLETSKFAALGQMAGGIAHEINTPLASIQLACENILDIGNQAPGVQDELKRETETVVRSAERINVIIQGLRTFSKNDRKAAARSETVHSLIEEALSLTREQLRAEKLDLRLRPGDVELKVRARSIDVTQILLNLITNACDATQGLDDRWIEIDFAGVGDASVAIRVTDSGPGIKLEHRARLFEPFFTTKAIGAGTGLGLSVARNLADANGGTLELDVSAKNTRFVLKLPQSSE